MSEQEKRITIQYSIKLGDLSAEVERLYSQAAENLKALALDEVSHSEILDSSLVKKIDEVRKNLASTDLMLMDIQSIVSSYIQYEVSLNSQEAELQNAITPPTDIQLPDGPTTLDDLAEIMSNVAQST
tara:strand:- start:2376 stop:2759 length:384 start_codon:yes stop_codon:yes gene_type:complete